MKYVIDPHDVFVTSRCRTRSICNRLSIYPVCPPNLICPLK